MCACAWAPACGLSAVNSYLLPTWVLGTSLRLSRSWAITFSNWAILLPSRLSDCQSFFSLTFATPSQTGFLISSFIDEEIEASRNQTDTSKIAQDFLEKIGISTILKAILNTNISKHLLYMKGRALLIRRQVWKYKRVKVLSFNTLPSSVPWSCTDLQC